MSDEAWRRRNRDEEEQFGPPLFGDDSTDPTQPGERISFGVADTGPLPHWTEPATGQLPSTLGTSEPVDHTDDLDVWSSFSGNAPVWSDDPTPTGEFEMPARASAPSERTPGDIYDEDLEDPTAQPRRGQGRITIGTDPTDDRMGRPMPAGRGRNQRGEIARGARPTARPSSTPAAAQSGRNMPMATAVGLGLLAVFIGSLLIAPAAAVALVILIIGLASVEFFGRVTDKGYRPATVVGILACAAFPLAAYWVGERSLPVLMFVAFVAGCLTFITASSLESSPLPNMAVTTLGITWIGFTGAFAALILAHSTVATMTAATVSKSIGTDTLFLIMLGVVANDVGALFVGSAAGRTPLRQWISPNKTVEGLIGGTLMTMLAMIVVGVADKSTTWNTTGDLLILGVVIAIAAPLGDLTESMFKRNLDVKDFGTLVKGHGGVLDRFDGFLFTLPAVYYLMEILQPWVTK